MFSKCVIPELRITSIDAVPPDYDSVNDGQVSLFFRPGDEEKNLTISIYDDDIVEGLECFEVSIADPEDDGDLRMPYCAIVNIKDDDGNDFLFS